MLLVDADVRSVPQPPTVVGSAQNLLQHRQRWQ
jgi:hypothetical protein